MANGPNPYAPCSKPCAIGARSVYSRRVTHGCVVLVNDPMTNSHALQNVGKMRKYVRIDQETFADLNILFDRVADTLGTIAPVLELAKDKNATEKKRHLRAVLDLAFRGHHALKAFSRQWALVLEENEKPLYWARMEDFADIFQEAKQITIPKPPLASAGNTGADYTLCKVVSTDPTPDSGSVLAEETHGLG